MNRLYNKPKPNRCNLAEIPASVQVWADGAWDRIRHKIGRTSRRIGVSCPHASVNGVYDDMRVSWWTAKLLAGHFMAAVRGRRTTRIQGHRGTVRRTAR